VGDQSPLNQPALGALVKWAGRLVESDSEDYVFPAREAAGIEREHLDKERIDRTKPIKSWRSAWRAALKRAGLQIRFHDLRHTVLPSWPSLKRASTRLWPSRATSVAK
jgi:integrase